MTKLTRKIEELKSELAEAMANLTRKLEESKSELAESMAKLPKQENGEFNSNQKFH